MSLSLSDNLKNVELRTHNLVLTLPSFSPSLHVHTNTHKHTPTHTHTRTNIHTNFFLYSSKIVTGSKDKIHEKNNAIVINLNVELKNSKEAKSKRRITTKPDEHLY